MNDDLPNPGFGLGRFVGTVFGLIFLGIGLTVIGFLWGAPFGKFGSPPLFFRIFGSFIALAFVTMGGATAYAAISGKASHFITRQRSAIRNARLRQNADSSATSPTSDGYSCNKCGAPLGSNADVSPHGDVKCAHCDRWFNVHNG